MDKNPYRYRVRLVLEDLEGADDGYTEEALFITATKSREDAVDIYEYTKTALAERKIALLRKETVH